VIFSEPGKAVYAYETGEKALSLNPPFREYNNKDFFAPPASGSAGFDAMIVIPSTMGTLGRIASGTADDLICRSADVMLKERRKLILVAREMPYNLIHLENMRTLTLAGAIICPASPSFYSHPVNMEAMVGTVTDKVLQLAGLAAPSFRWGEEQ